MRPLGVQVLSLAYRTGGSSNESGFANKEFDEKLDQTLTVSDPEKRKVVMKDVEQILESSGILVQAYWRKLFNHSAASVKNFHVHPTQELSLEDVWLDA